MATRRPPRAPTAVQAPQLLRFATAGSVDDGKSTLIGRLLYDSKALMADQVADAELDLARLTDGLRAEREQGITIDVAYRHFSTPRRRFIIADTPGHAQYTRNMVTGASTADVAVVLVDAREGLLTQSRRHAAIAGLLRIPRIVLAVEQDGPRRLRPRRLPARSAPTSARGRERLDVEEITCIPISALKGDNVVERSSEMDWYRGPTLLQFLETAPVAVRVAGGRCGFPVQYVIRSGEQRAYAGQLAGGTVRPGDEVVVLPGRPGDARHGRRGARRAAGAGERAAVGRRLARGRAGRRPRGADLRPADRPRAARDIEATVCWMGESPGRAGGRYVLKHTTRSRARAARGGARDARRGDALDARPAATRSASTTSAACRCGARPSSSSTRTRSTARRAPSSSSTRRRNDTVGRGDDRRWTLIRRSSANVVWQRGLLDREQRWAALGHPGATVWMTGLPASGKSTVAAAVEAQLLGQGRTAYVLDGDNLRHGLNGDLGFSAEDRAENVRRTAEVSALLADAGVVVLVGAGLALPRRPRGRPGGARAPRAAVPGGPRRDEPRGVRAARPEGPVRPRARRRAEGLTGVDDPYEPPEAADVVVSGAEALEEAVARVLAALPAA